MVVAAVVVLLACLTGACGGDDDGGDDDGPTDAAGQAVDAASQAADAAAGGACSGPDDCGGEVCCDPGLGAGCVPTFEDCSGLVLCGSPDDCPEVNPTCCPQGFCGGCD